MANGWTLGKDKAMIFLADALSWCASYKGDKFHALLCDPPYHLYSPVSKRPAGKWDGTRKDPFQRVKGGGFMGKDWDGGDIAFQPETWAALAEHLHDGAFIMAFASSRGWHRQAVAMEDAGLIMHPSIFGWAYGSGFPKATRIDTQIDKAAGLTQEVVHSYKRKGRSAGIMGKEVEIVRDITAPATDLAKAWAGHRYGLQALKPAVEPILVFQKPYRGKPVECITRTGAGALNIDGGRIIALGGLTKGGTTKYGGSFGNDKSVTNPEGNPLGRWPSNLILSHTPECKRIGEKKVRSTSNYKGGGTGGIWSGVTNKPVSDGYVGPDGTETIPEWECPEYCPVRRLGEQSGELKAGVAIRHNIGHSKRANIKYAQGSIDEQMCDDITYADSGTAARFFFQADWELENTDPIFYTAKASRSERDAGLEGFEAKREFALNAGGREAKGTEADWDDVTKRWISLPKRNAHPTVKPIRLTQHLATLLLPPVEYAPRRLLVPFAGVGSEMIGAMLAGWEEVVGIELSQEYAEIAEARLNYWQTRQLELL